MIAHAAALVLACFQVGSDEMNDLFHFFGQPLPLLQRLNIAPDSNLLCKPSTIWKINDMENPREALHLPQPPSLYKS